MHCWVGKGGKVRQCWMVELETKTLSHNYLDIFGASLNFAINFEPIAFTFPLGVNITLLLTSSNFACHIICHVGILLMLTFGVDLW